MAANLRKSLVPASYSKDTLAVRLAAVHRFHPFSDGGRGFVQSIVGKLFLWLSDPVSTRGASIWMSKRLPARGQHLPSRNAAAGSGQLPPPQSGAFLPSCCFYRRLAVQCPGRHNGVEVGHANVDHVTAERSHYLQGLVHAFRDIVSWQVAQHPTSDRSLGNGPGRPSPRRTPFATGRETPSRSSNLPKNREAKTRLAPAAAALVPLNDERQVQSVWPQHHRVLVVAREGVTQG